MSRGRRRAPAALLGGVLAGYANSFSGAFQFDDYNVIVDNPAVHSLAAWGSSLAGGGIRPILKLSYALNWALGPGPFGFHMFNVAVHAANTLLVYALSRRLAERGSPGAGSPDPVLPLAAAMLFALHPVQTEAVTYISGRSMSLMALFYLASLWTYVRGADAGSRLQLRLASPLLFLLALATRESAVTLPAALLLWELSSPGERPAAGAILRRQAAHWAILACAAAAILLHPVYLSIIASGFSPSAPWGNLPAQAHGAAYLLTRLAMAHRLNIDPDLRVPSVWTASTAAEALLLLSLLSVGVWSLRRAPVAGFGILWFFLHLAPSNSFIPRADIANERHLYLACWGIFLCVGLGAGWLLAAGAPRRALAAAVLLAVAMLGVLTIARNRDYRSEVALWESTVRLSPGKPRVQNNLGYAFQLAGMREMAIASYREALRLDGSFGPAKGNLEALLAGEGPEGGHR